MFACLGFLLLGYNLPLLPDTMKGARKTIWISRLLLTEPGSYLVDPGFFFAGEEVPKTANVKCRCRRGHRTNFDNALTPICCSPVQISHLNCG